MTTTQDNPTIIADRYTSNDRPAQVTDHKGYTWTAVPHGALTPKERDNVWGPVPPRFAEDDLVRLQQHSVDITQIARLTPEGALELAYQLIVSARRAKGENQPLPRVLPEDALRAAYAGQNGEEDVVPALGPLTVLAQQFIEHQGAGQIVLTASETPNDNESPEWSCALTFGREAPDSDMAAGAAYGVDYTAEGALRAALAEAGVREQG
jgi:hypothetical protein